MHWFTLGRLSTPCRPPAAGRAQRFGRSAVETRTSHTESATEPRSARAVDPVTQTGDRRLGATHPGRIADRGTGSKVPRGRRYPDGTLDLATGDVGLSRTRSPRPTMELESHGQEM
jgi:hypothetical protein